MLIARGFHYLYQRTAATRGKLSASLLIDNVLVSEWMGVLRASCVV